MPRLWALGANQVWSWDILYLLTTVPGIWLYLYLVIVVWSCKLVAWDVDESEDPAIAADLISRACLGERISKRREQPLILHDDIGNAIFARSRTAWKNWAFSGRSHVQGSQTTTRTRNPCSGR